MKVTSFVQALLLSHHNRREDLLLKHLITLRRHLCRKQENSEKICKEILQVEMFRDTSLYLIQHYSSQVTDLHPKIIHELIWIMTNLAASKQSSTICPRFELDVLKISHIALYANLTDKFIEDILGLWVNLNCNPVVQPYFLETVLSEVLIRRIAVIKQGPAIQAFARLCSAFIIFPQTPKKDRKILSNRLLDTIIYLVSENLDDEETIFYSLKFLDFCFDLEYPGKKRLKKLNLFGLFKSIKSVRCIRAWIRVWGSLAYYDITPSPSSLQRILEILKDTLLSASREEYLAEIAFTLSNLLASGKEVCEKIFTIFEESFKQYIRSWLSHSNIKVVSEALYCLSSAFDFIPQADIYYFYDDLQELTQLKTENGEKFKIPTRAQELIERFT